MAEMTAQHYINRLKNPFDKKPRLLSLWSDEMNQIAALLEQQAAEIAASEQKYKNWIGPIEHKSLLDEIAKKDKMLNTAIEGLIKAFDCPADYGFDCPYCPDCDQSDVKARDCWLSWLEKEAQGA
jgi:hypothetical protein